MHWLEESSEQFVPHTPTIFHSFSQGSSQNSPNAAVPENSDYSSSQESQDSQEANVPGTPVNQSNVHNFVASTTPIISNRKSRYGTPLLEIVLLKSARKHTEDYLICTLEQNSSPNSPQLEQTVPSTPKQENSVLKEQSAERVKKTYEKLDLFEGDEIFPK